LEYSTRLVGDQDYLLNPKCFHSRSSRYRTPLCILYGPRLIAIACIVLAQRVFDGPTSPSLDARISASSPSKSLPTPPSNQPPSPDASRAVVVHYNLQDSEVEQVAGSCNCKHIELPLIHTLTEALSILLEFYSAQDPDQYPYLSTITAVSSCVSTVWAAEANQRN